MDAELSQLRDLMFTWSRPSVAIPRACESTFLRFVEAGHIHLRQNLEAHIRRARHKAIRVTVLVDGTPGKGYVRSLQRVGCETTARANRDRFEFLLFRIFCSYWDDMGRLQTCTSFRDAVIARRKDTWRCFQTLAECLINPRQVGHRGIVVWTLPLDGGLYSSLSRRFRQMLDVAASQPGRSAEQIQVALSFDWVFPILCFLHVVYNGLQRATEVHLLPDLKKSLDDIWSGMASLTSSWTSLISRLIRLFERALFSDEEGVSDSDLYAYWELLGMSFSQVSAM